MAIGNGQGDELRARYHRAVHRMQSATALMITRLGLNRAGADPKHLRVGLNSAMGLFTADEYHQAIVEAAERESDARVVEARAKCDLPDTVEFG